jgi:hypothetical protein
MKVLKWLGYTVLVLIVISIPAYWWLFMESHTPSSAHYSIDMTAVRRLADAGVVDLPVAIRVETIGHLLAPETFVIAGGGWRNLDMPVSAYEIVYKNHAVIIDTAFNADVAKQMGANIFDDAAYARLGAALATAQLIIVTYVKRADGQEILFLGDVAWQMRNIEEVRERARLVTWLVGEDREAVMGEFVELHRLHTAEPNLNMMPGHDSAELTRFLKAGLLTKGF